GTLVERGLGRRDSLLLRPSRFTSVAATSVAESSLLNARLNSRCCGVQRTPIVNTNQQRSIPEVRVWLAATLDDKSDRVFLPSLLSVLVRPYRSTTQHNVVHHRFSSVDSR